MVAPSRNTDKTIRPASSGSPMSGERCQAPSSIGRFECVFTGSGRTRRGCGASTACCQPAPALSRQIVKFSTVANATHNAYGTIKAPAQRSVSLLAGLWRVLVPPASTIFALGNPVPRRMLPAPYGFQMCGFWRWHSWITATCWRTCCGVTTSGVPAVRCLCSMR
jgi:hypothetical protein